MKEEYIITQEELALKGLQLSDYTIDDVFNNAIIELGLDICVDRICELCDNIRFESDIEEKFETIEKDENNNDVIVVDEKLVKVFKKLQYRVIYNLIFTTEDSPIDQSIDSIISHQLNIGKINGFQKGLYYRHN